MVDSCQNLKLLGAIDSNFAQDTGSMILSLNVQTKDCMVFNKKIIPLRPIYGHFGL